MSYPRVCLLFCNSLQNNDVKIFFLSIFSFFFKAIKNSPRIVKLADSLNKTSFLLPSAEYCNFVPDFSNQFFLGDSKHPDFALVCFFPEILLSKLNCNRTARVRTYLYKTVLRCPRCPTNSIPCWLNWDCESFTRFHGHTCRKSLFVRFFLAKEGLNLVLTTIIQRQLCLQKKM